MTVPSFGAPRLRRCLRLAGPLIALALASLASPAFASEWLPGPAASGDPTYVGFIDAPARGSTPAAGAPVRVAGWVVDRTAQGWAGIDAVHVYSGRAGEGGVFLGQAAIAQSRPDVAAALGNPYWAASGFSLIVPPGRIGTGARTLVVYAHTPSKGWWFSEVPLGGAAAMAFQPVAPAPVASRVTPTAAQKQFIDQVGSIARAWRSQIGLPPSLVVAIAINESGWGRSTLATEAQNYFGIKAHRGPGPAGTYEAETWEVVNGERVTITASFRAYHSLEESVRDLGTFLHTNPRYSGVWAVAGDPNAAARALLAAGYATDPAWADKLIRLIDLYGLRDLDRP